MIINNFDRVIAVIIVSKTFINNIVNNAANLVHTLLVLRDFILVHLRENEENTEECLASSWGLKVLLFRVVRLR